MTQRNNTYSRGLHEQPWMHLPLKKKLLLRQLFNSYCPAGSLGFTGKTRYNSLSSTALLWFGTAHLPRHTYPQPCHRGSPELQHDSKNSTYLWFFHPRRGAKQAVEKEYFPHSILWYSEAKVCYNGAWIDISHLTNERLYLQHCQLLICLDSVLLLHIR